MPYLPGRKTKSRFMIYRQCVVCAVPIPEERLIVLPDTVTCVDHSQVFRRVVDADGPDGVDLIAHLQSGGVEN